MGNAYTLTDVTVQGRTKIESEELFMNAVIFSTILLGLIIGAAILTIITNQMLEKTDSIDLVQGKIKNSDFDIADATPYLRIADGKER